MTAADGIAELEQLREAASAAFTELEQRWRLHETAMGTTALGARKYVEALDSDSNRAAFLLEVLRLHLADEDKAAAAVAEQDAVYEAAAAGVVARAGELVRAFV